MFCGGKSFKFKVRSCFLPSSHPDTIGVELEPAVKREVQCLAEAAQTIEVAMR